jgi:ubiquinone/menaquinone biosynthesis C-methylase UbiE
MDEFLADFAQGTQEYRYVAAELPSLPFMDQTFELAVCSHFLFLYSEQFDLDFHLESIRELCRVAEEVRIYPLLELGASKSRHLGPLITALTQEGLQPELVEVGYEFQKGAHQMLRVGSR